MNNTPAPPQRRAGPTTTAREEAPGWSDIRDVVTYADLAAVPGLLDNRHLEAQWKLLRTLIGGSPRDFIVNFTALRILVATDRGDFSESDLRRATDWLTEEDQTRLLNALRQAWLRHVPGRGWTVPYEAHALYELLSLLFRKTAADDILSATYLQETAQRLGMDEPERILESFHTRLIKLSQELEEAEQSGSEVRLRQIQGRLPQGPALMKAAREAVQEVPFTPKREALINGTFGAASRVANHGSDVIRQIQALERDHIPLPEGYAMRHVTEALQRQSLEGLADLGRRCLLPVYTARAQLLVAAVCSGADLQAQRERPTDALLPLEDEPIPVRPDEPDASSQDALAFLAELESIDPESLPTLQELVPAKDHPTSALRLSLLALLDQPPFGEGITARFAQLGYQVETDGEIEHPTTGPWKSISRGRLRRKKP